MIFLAKDTRIKLALVDGVYKVVTINNNLAVISPLADLCEMTKMVVREDINWESSLPA